MKSEVQHPWLVIASFDDLIANEKQILERIEKMPNGSNLFLIHPFQLLTDIGVQLSDQAQVEVLADNPQISGLSRTPYDALKRSKGSQKVNYRLSGLFARRGK